MVILFYFWGGGAFGRGEVLSEEEKWKSQERSVSETQVCFNCELLVQVQYPSLW